MKSRPASPYFPALTSALQAFFQAVYEDPRMLQRFHADVNLDENAEVPAFQGNARTLTFHTPINAPAVVSRIIGTGVIQVTETQEFAVNEDGTIQIISTPVPQVAMASYFSSGAVLVLRDGPEGGCEIDATVTCVATGPYGLIGTIESFMAEAAKKSLADFLGYAAEYVAMRQPNGHVAPPTAAMPILAPRLQEEAQTPLPSSLEDTAEFFDVEDGVSMLGEPGPGSLDVLATQLQQIAKTSEQTAAALRSIDARLARVEALIASKSTRKDALIQNSEASSGLMTVGGMTFNGGALAAGAALTGALAVALAFAWRPRHSIT